MQGISISAFFSFLADANLNDDDMYVLQCICAARIINSGWFRGVWTCPGHE